MTDTPPDSAACPQAADHHLMVSCGVCDYALPYRTDFLDYPTAWRVQSTGLEHTTPKCSAVQSPAFLCDCGAVAIKWADLVEAQGDPRPEVPRG